MKFFIADYTIIKSGLVPPLFYMQMAPCLLVYATCNSSHGEASTSAQCTCKHLFVLIYWSAHSEPTQEDPEIHRQYKVVTSTIHQCRPCQFCKECNPFFQIHQICLKIIELSVVVQLESCICNLCWDDINKISIQMETICVTLATVKYHFYGMHVMAIIIFLMMTKKGFSIMYLHEWCKPL